MNYQTVSDALGKWANKPLAKLPRDLQSLAKAYIPQWQTLTPRQRTDRAIEVDRQRGVKSKLRYDRTVKAQRAARESVEDSRAWYDTTLEADHWTALGDISPMDAAMLLCRFNPNAETYDSAMLTTTDELGPEHLKRLTQRLVDIDQSDHRPRTLRDWHQTALGKKLAYHSWIDGYMDVTTPPATLLADTTLPEPKIAHVGIDVGWSIKRPQRFQGYGNPLFKLLTAAHVAGKSIPTARDVIDAWAVQKPPEVIESSGDGIKYYDAKGNTKPADLDAIRQAIKRMIE